MLTRSLRLGRLFGIEIRLDYSWFIVLVLVTWSLAGSVFPFMLPGQASLTYWGMGLLTALLFFSSVLVHEIAHSLVSGAFGIHVHDITLFIFGGASQITEEPRHAKDEFLMALAGPFTSFGLAVLFGLLWFLTNGSVPALNVLTGWLAVVNFSLGLFNLIPGFPLDGGRVFRSIVWAVTGNLRQATRIATRLGQLTAFAFIFIGIWQMFGGNWLNGLWIAFIGWFLDNAATSSYRSVTIRDLLVGHTAREIMTSDCPAVPMGDMLEDVVHDKLLPTGRRCLLVTQDEKIMGLLTVPLIGKIPRERWHGMTAGQAMVPVASLKTVGPDDGLSLVFDRMAAEDLNQLPVMKDGQYLGMVARDNLLAFLRTRQELGG